MFNKTYDHFMVLEIFFFSIQVSNFFTLGEFAFSYPPTGYVLRLFPNDEDKSVQVNLISISLFNPQAVGKDSEAGVGMSGTLVPMGTGVPAGTHRNLENLGTAGYRVPRKF